jgi:hypothetical protein
MSEGHEVQRLLQAVEHFKSRTRGAELPEGVAELVDGLQEKLGQPLPGRDTPGSREALKLAPGTNGTGAPLKQAAKGPDGPSPGQRAAQSVSAAIDEAAASIAAGR